MPTKDEVHRDWSSVFVLRNANTSSPGPKRNKNKKGGTEIGNIKFVEGELIVEIDKK